MTEHPDNAPAGSVFANRDADVQEVTEAPETPEEEAAETPEEQATEAEEDVQR